MKKFFVLAVVFLNIQSSIFAQGMFVRKSNIALDIGAGYIQNTFSNLSDYPNSYNEYSFNVSACFLKIFDVGGAFYKPINPEGEKPLNDASSYYLNVYFSKKSLGVVMNTAFSNMSNASSLLLGLSIYGDFSKINGVFFLDGIYPMVSGGIILSGANEDFAFGFSFPLQKIINDHYFIILTPGFNYSNEDIQLLVGLDFIFQ